MNKIFAGFIIAVIFIMLMGAGVTYFSSIDFVSKVAGATYYNRIFTTKDSLWFRFSDESTERLIFPFTEIDSMHTDYIDFDLDVVIESSEGRLYWNDEDKTLNLGMAGGNVALQIGQEILIRAKNGEGATISNGEVVYVSGGVGSNPIVKLADKSIEAEACASIAVATETVLDAQFGYFTSYGLVRELNTSAFEVGDILYLGSDGELDTLTTYPDYQVRVGYVIRDHISEGVIFVDIHDQCVYHKLTSDYVPYSGANSNVDLGSYNLKTTGDITVQGNFYPQAVVGKMVESTEIGSEITCTVADTYYQWVTADSVHSSASKGIVYIDSTHVLKVPYDGRYYVAVTAAIQMDNVGEVHMCIAKNGVISVRGCSHYEFKFAKQDITMSVVNSPELVAGDELSLYFASDGAGDIITTSHINFVVFWLGE